MFVSIVLISLATYPGIQPQSTTTEPPKLVPNLTAVDCGVASGDDYTYLVALKQMYLENGDLYNLCVIEFNNLWRYDPRQLEPALKMNCSDQLFGRSIDLSAYTGTPYQLQCARKYANTYETQSGPVLKKAALAFLDLSFLESMDALWQCSQYQLYLNPATITESMNNALAQFDLSNQVALAYGKFGLLIPADPTSNANVTEKIKSGFDQISAEFGKLKSQIDQMDRALSNEPLFMEYMELNKNIDEVQAAFEILTDSYFTTDPQPMLKFARLCQQQNLHVTTKLLVKLFQRNWSLRNVNFTAVEPDTFIFMLSRMANSYLDYPIPWYNYPTMATIIRGNICRLAYLREFCDASLSDNEKMLDAGTRSSQYTNNYILRQLKSGNNKVENEIAQVIQPQVLGMLADYSPELYDHFPRTTYYLAIRIGQLFVAAGVLSIESGGDAQLTYSEPVDPRNCVISQEYQGKKIFVYLHNSIDNVGDQYGADTMLAIEYNNETNFFNGTGCDNITAKGIRNRHRILSLYEPSLIMTGYYPSMVGNMTEPWSADDYSMWTGPLNGSGSLYHFTTMCQKNTSFGNWHRMHFWIFPFCNLQPLDKPYQPQAPIIV